MRKVGVHLVDDFDDERFHFGVRYSREAVPWDFAERGDNFDVLKVPACAGWCYAGVKCFQLSVSDALVDEHLREFSHRFVVPILLRFGIVGGIGLRCALPHVSGPFLRGSHRSYA